MLVAIFGAVFLFALVMLASQGFRSTGYVTETTTTSNVTVNVYFSIALSTNLSRGIQFGDVSTLPAYNLNGTANNDSGFNTTISGPPTSASGTTYYANVSTDSNSAVDFCIKADLLNTSSGDFIGLGNETYMNSTATNTSAPFVVDETSFTTAYVKSGDDIAIGSTNYYRFWLDVPASTATGTYNNTVSFKGVTSTGSC